MDHLKRISGQHACMKLFLLILKNFPIGISSYVVSWKNISTKVSQIWYLMSDIQCSEHCQFRSRFSYRPHMTILSDIIEQVTHIMKGCVFNQAFDVRKGYQLLQQATDYIGPQVPPNLWYFEEFYCIHQSISQAFEVLNGTCFEY